MVLTYTLDNVYFVAVAIVSSNSFSKMVFHIVYIGRCVCLWQIVPNTLDMPHHYLAHAYMEHAASVLVVVRPMVQPVFRNFLPVEVVILYDP